MSNYFEQCVYWYYHRIRKLATCFVERVKLIEAERS